jgi:hypothetical protein
MAKQKNVMERKKRNSGIPIILIGTLVLAQQLTRIHYEHIRKVDFVVLGSSLIFIGIGLYVYLKKK